jgi:hypothetical protein
MELWVKVFVWGIIMLLIILFIYAIGYDPRYRLRNDVDKGGKWVADIASAMLEKQPGVHPGRVHPGRGRRLARLYSLLLADSGLGRRPIRIRDGTYDHYITEAYGMLGGTAFVRWSGVRRDSVEAAADRLRDQISDPESVSRRSYFSDPACDLHSMSANIHTMADVWLALRTALGIRSIFSDALV